MDPFAEALKIVREADLEYEREQSAVTAGSTTVTVLAGPPSFRPLLVMPGHPVYMVLKQTGYTLTVAPLWGPSPVERWWNAWRHFWRATWEFMWTGYWPYR